MWLRVLNSKVKFCILSVAAVLAKKWKIMFFLFAAALLLIATILTIIPHRRPNTKLIYNNKHLCSSNSPIINSVDQRPKILSTSEISQIPVVIVVLSARKNFKARNLIRETWGSVRYVNNINILAVVFMLGVRDVPEEVTTDIVQLENERLLYNDLIIGDFVDTYRNLTLKTIMAYDWLLSFCSEAKAVVKTDDDVMVNIFKLTEELALWTPNVFASSNFWCAIHWGEKPLREEGSRYHISLEQYAGDVIPMHCGGVGYVTTMTVLRRISDEISRSFLGVVCTHEDVFMTGIVPEKINSYQNEPIQFINKMEKWISYALVYEMGDKTQYLSQLLQKPTEETIDVDEFRQKFPTEIFYLLDKGAEFEYRYRRLWQFVEKAFRVEENDESY